MFAHTARGDEEGWDEGFEPPPPFEITGAHIGDVKPATSAAPAHAAGSRIVAIDGGALVIDADSGNLLRTDRGGALTGQLPISVEAGLMVYDEVARRAYIADRLGDRIIAVNVGEKLAIAATWKTPAEPYGVALAADRKTLLVTTIADRALAAYDVTRGAEMWRTPLGAEPRGVAISPDGTRAVIAMLATGTLEQVALDDRRLVRRVSLPVDTEGQRARGAFAVAFVGSTAVAPYQLEIPIAKNPDASGQYGGSFTPPIVHGVGFLAADGRQASGRTSVHEPRALAWDRARDVLYVAGLATDELVAIPKASQVDIGEGQPANLRQRCGADGIAIAADGAVLVWCSFTRSVARFDLTKHGGLAKVAKGPQLVASKLDKTHHEGLVLFHTANAHISGFGGMSCGNCHLDGRADGLSWKIGTHALQTPVLAGRVAGTEPFKWDGGAKDLSHSLKATIGRLGGSGLSKKQLASLTGYVETMPAIRTPTRSAEAVARGKKLFESEQTGCTSCHDGPAYTDREQHELVGAKGAFDTPSLRALAASAPYFHDGSAATLATVLRDRGKIHGMSAGATKLSEAELSDLIAFLETL
ncbi:MAG: c-type cytochrome [Myxococcota bacterium]|nr:c-type cytochrome [Myxococcota bacterium]